MEKIEAWVKAHPWATGLLVVGGIVVFVVFSGWFSGGSSTTTSSGSTGPTDAQLAASTQLGVAQITAGVAGKQSDNTLAADTMAAQVASLEYSLQNQLGLANIAAQTQVQLAGIGATTDVATLQAHNSVDLATIGAATTQNTVQAQTQVQLAQINSNEDLVKAVITALTPAPPAPVIVAPPPPPPAPVIVPPAPSYIDSSGNLTTAGVQQIEQDRPDVLAAALANRGSNVYQDINFWYSQGAPAAGDTYRLPTAH